MRPVPTYMWTGEGKEYGKNASYSQLVENGVSEVFLLPLPLPQMGRQRTTTLSRFKLQRGKREIDESTLRTTPGNRGVGRHSSGCFSLSSLDVAKETTSLAACKRVPYRIGKVRSPFCTLLSAFSSPSLPSSVSATAFRFCVLFKSCCDVVYVWRALVNAG